MAETASLFARKLRAWRMAHGSHGRMTQEQLAELLGVSVDAVGKYERSLSFLRGDLEHRLVDRLGWSSEDVVACRVDWEERQKATGRRAYRILDEERVARLFGGSWHAAARASVTFAEDQFPGLPRAFAPNDDVFTPIYAAYPEHWAAVLSGDRIVAKWALPFLMPADVERFRSGLFLESDLSLDRIHRPILPGTYFGYCPALIVGRGHEAASALLLSSFIAFLERLARRDVYVSSFGTVSVTPGGAQVCRDLGMTLLRQHALHPEFGIWELSGASVPGSLFGRRSAYLRARYAEAFPERRTDAAARPVSR